VVLLIASAAFVVQCAGMSVTVSAADTVSWQKTLEEATKNVKQLYGYFNNHYQGHSPASAREMQRLLGQLIDGEIDIAADGIEWIVEFVRPAGSKGHA
jgi:hypothetical protein